ncbi:hypothetical protein WG66_004872 [Moniliophthora roreri]|nr:hypothetical protein WG66_004872 [Moniliophthora roreri]
MTYPNHPWIVLTTSPSCHDIWKVWKQADLDAIVAYMKGFVRGDVGPVPRYLSDGIDTFAQADEASDKAVQPLFKCSMGAFVGVYTQTLLIASAREIR